MFVDANCYLEKLAIDKIAELKYGIKGVTFDNTTFNKIFINNLNLETGDAACDKKYFINNKCLEIVDCTNEKFIIYDNPECNFSTTANMCKWSISYNYWANLYLSERIVNNLWSDLKQATLTKSYPTI